MLRIENLKVRYRATNQKVLDGISFDVASGEVVAIVGASGCGKTTLLNMVAGLIHPGDIVQEGRVTIKTKKIATVFQEPRLLPWKTVLQNVTFGLEAQGEEADLAAERAKKTLIMVGLEDFIEYYPSQLSIGMKQRVNFARAIVCDPELLLMDEPFSALDVDTKEAIVGEFKNVIKRLGLTTVFVTHDKREAKTLADRVVTMGGGFVGVSRNYGGDETLAKIFGTEIIFHD